MVIMNLPKGLGALFIDGEKKGGVDFKSGNSLEPRLDLTVF